MHRYYQQFDSPLIRDYGSVGWVLNFSTVIHQEPGRPHMMTFVMRAVGTLFGCLVLASVSLAQELRSGDFGYKHHQLHSAYQELLRKLPPVATPVDVPLATPVVPKELKDAYGKIFGSLRCHCTAGECRPTEYKGDSASPSGVIMRINGKWCPIPAKALLTKKDLEVVQVPDELMKDPAHVCASASLAADGCPTTIECGWLNGNM